MRDWLLAFAAFAAGRLAQRNYLRLPGLPLAARLDTGHVSIIVPCRNESTRLPALLASLHDLEYGDHDVLVVDDGSSDGTAEVARRAGVPVVSAGELPLGWAGKPHACWQGARQTRGEWLLFTDADTRHRPASLGRAIALADEHDAEVVSLLANQICSTFWERVLLPYAYFLYFTGAGGVNTSRERRIANGQYILCRRDAYQRFGGHAAVRDSLIEDVQLARVAVRLGVRVVLARGEDAVEVRMYENLAALWQGFSKNTFRFVRDSPRSGIVTAVTGLLFATCAMRAVKLEKPQATVLCLIAPTVALGPWYRRFNVTWQYAALFPLAATIFQVVALDSIRRTISPGQTVWKGRRY